MRRKVLVLIAAAVAGMLVLTACTSTENKDMQEAGAGVSGEAVSGTASQSGDSSGEDSTASAGAESGDEGNDVQTGQNVAGIPVDGSTGDSSSASGGDTSQSSSPSTGQDVAGSSSNGIVSGEFDGVYQAGDKTDGDSEEDDIWTGVYGNDTETLTITYVDDETISFVFTNSGIYGKAEVKGYQAVYKGDDYHVVVFNIHDNVVDVSVSSEEDYDTSGSPLIGTYIKDYVNDVLEEETDGSSVDDEDGSDEDDPEEDDPEEDDAEADDMEDDLNE